MNKKNLPLSPQAHSILTHSLAPTLLLNHQLDILSFNAAAEKSLGYQEREVLGRPLFDLLHEAEKLNRNITREEFLQKSMILFKEKNHNRAPAQVVIHALPGEEEELYIAHFRRVRSVSEADQKLHDTNILLDTITRIESQFILSKDPSNLSEIFSDLSEALRTVTSSCYSILIQLTDKKPEQIATTPSDWKQEVKALFQKGEVSDPLLKQLSPYIEKVIQEPHPLFLDDLDSLYGMAVPLLQNDELIGISLLLSETTPFEEETLHFIFPILQVAIIIIEGSALEEERRRSRRLLRAHDEKLTELVKTLAERNRELKSARDEALEASRAKSHFLANMSHEIRTPLNGIMGMTELLMNTPLDDQQQNYATKVYQSAEHLLTVINDILDLSKVEAGKVELETIPFNIKTLANDTLTTVETKALNKSLKINVEWGELPSNTFIGDPTRLKQVLINLMANAIKFTEEGTITLKIEFTENKELGKIVRFSVVDTGIGIKKEKLEDVFKAFDQADTSTTRKFGGTGLGLTISKQLVELMGGEMNVKSEEGVGTTFNVDLPLKTVRKS